MGWRQANRLSTGSNPASAGRVLDGVNTLSAILLGAALLGTFPSHGQSQTKGKTQTPQQAKQELDTAKDKLKDANQDLGKAEKDMEKAEAAHQAAVAKIQKARQAAVVEHGKKLGLPIALGQRDAAQRAIEAAHTTLTKEIRGQPEHQAAVKEAEKASARLQQVREDATLNEEKKQQLSSELSKTIRRPAEIERERIEADANIQQLRLKAAEAGRQATIVLVQAQKAAEEDGDVKGALQAERDTADKVKSARADVEKHKKEVATAQAKVNSETQQYQKAASAAKTAKKGKNDK